MRVLLVLDLHDMHAVNRLDEPDFSGLHRERGILEFLHRLRAHDPPDFPAALGAGILGMLLGQCGEVGAGLDLGQNVLSGLLNRRDLRRILAGGLEQDVRHLDAVGHPIVREVPAIVLLQGRLINLDLRANAVRIDQHVADAALGRRLVALGVLLEEGIERRRRDLDRLQEPAGIENHVLDLRLGIALDELFVHLRWSYHHAVCDHAPHFIEQQFLPELRLELPHRQTLRLESVLVGVHTDKLAVLIKPRNSLKGLEHLLRGDFESQFLGLLDHRTLEDHLIERALGDTRHELGPVGRWHIAQLGVDALPQVLRRDARAIHRGQHVSLRLGRVAAAQRGQRDHHAHGHNRQECGQDPFVDGAAALAK